ncbi:MAG: hypothetical protein SynsKO_10030 [Synoicihabitans sp.]
MKKVLNTPRLFLGLLILIQFSVPLSMIMGRERILERGEVYRFVTQPIDPIDPFQGRYVVINPQQNFIAGSKAEQSHLTPKQKGYALISTDSEGFAYFSSWTTVRPAEDDYLQTKIIGSSLTRENGNRIHRGMTIQVPFNRFYMDEMKAPAAEKLVADASRIGECWVQVRVYEGQAVIENVFVDGMEISELVDREN